MLVRHLFGYLPAYVIPAATSFLAVYFYTRLLSPADYGVYSLTLTVAIVCQALFFYWLETGASRFHARAEMDASTLTLAGTIYRGIGYCAVVLGAIALAARYVVHDAQAFQQVMLLGFVLVLLKSVIAVNQAFNRSALRLRRYNLIECIQGLLGLVFAVVLTRTTGGGAVTILAGLVAAVALAGALDIAAIGRSIRTPPDPQLLRALLAFGLPLTACYAFGYLLNTADRVLIGYFLGPAAVGVYSVAFNTVDRSIMSIFAAVSTAAFPLVVRALETHGEAAARVQFGFNGMITLGLTLPASFGLIAATPQFAQVLIGEAFRADALVIMPWVVFASLMLGLQVHYFSHAFHLAKNTVLLMWSIGPAAILNVILNLIMLPRFGLIGAVWAILISCAVTLVSSVYFGHKVFRFAFPLRAAVEIALASVLMGATIWRIDFPRTSAGLLAAIVTGIVAYSCAVLALNVGGVRNWVVAQLRARGRRYG